MRPRFLIPLFAALAAVPGCLQTDKQETAVNWQSDRDRVRNAKPAPDIPIMPKTYFAAGRMLEGQGNLLGALAQYEKAIAANPRYSQAYSRLGILYQQLGRYEDADQAFFNGISAVPSSASLRNNFGYCLFLQRRTAEAMEQYRAALEIRPGFAKARMNLASLLAHSGRGAESYTEFCRVVSSDVAYYNIGVIRLELGDFKSATNHFHEAIEINPELTAATEGLRRATALARKSDPGLAPSLAGSIEVDEESPVPLP